MFSFITVLITAIIGVIFWILGGKQSSGSDCEIAFCVFAIIFWVIASIWLILMTVGTYTYQLSDFTEIKGKKQQIRIYEERRDNLTGIIKAELAKYPEYEKQIIAEISPEILVNFPNLRSSETITKTVEEIVKLNDSVYKIRASIVEVQQRIYYREISPWVIYVQPYEKFFSEQNPL